MGTIPLTTAGAANWLLTLYASPEVKPVQTPAVRSSKLVRSEEELKKLEATNRASEGGFEGILRFRTTY